MKRKIIMYVIIALLLACSYMSVSYAYYTTRKHLEDNIIDVNVPSCINLDLVDSEDSKINISGEASAPMSDQKAIESYDKNLSYEATVQNGCDEDYEITLMLAPTSSSSMPHKAVKYAISIMDSDDKPVFNPSFMVLDNNKKDLPSSVVELIKEKEEESSLCGYEISKFTINKKSKKYIKMISWIDENEGNLGENITVNKSFVAHLIMNSKEISK